MAERQTIKELLIGLKVNADNRKLKKFDLSLGKVRKAMLALKAVAVATSGAMTKFAADTARNSRFVEDFSRVIEVGTRRTQELVFAFRSAYSDSNDLADVLNTLTDRAEDAKAGMQSYIDDFGLLNLKVDELRGLQPIELFDKFVDAVSQSTDASKRNAAIVRLLGDDLGRRLLPLVTQGREGFEALAEAAQESGRVLSQEQIQKSAELAMAMFRLRQSLIGVRDAIGIALIPVVRQSTLNMTSFLNANREIIASSAKQFMEGLAKVLGLVQKGFLALSEAAGGTERLFRLLEAAIIATTVAMGAKGLVNAAKSAAQALSFIFANPKILLIGAAIAAAVLLIEDLLAYMRGGESVIGGIIEKLQSGEGFLGRVGAIAQSIGSSIKAAWDWLLPWLQSTGQAIATASVAVWGALQTTWDWITRVYGVVAEKLAPTFRELGSVMSSAFKAFSSSFKLVWSLISGLFEVIVATMSGIWKVVKPIWQTAWSVLSGYLKFVIKWWSMLGRVVVAYLRVVIGNIAKVLGMAFKIVSRVINTVLTLVRGAISVVTTVMNAISLVVSSVMDAIKGFVDGLFDKVSDVTTSIGAAFGNAFESVRDVVRDVMEWIEEKVDAVFGRIGDAVDRVSRIGRGIGRGVRGAVGAVGGVFGARRSTESITSQVRNNNMNFSAGSSVINVNANGGGLNPIRIAEEVARVQEQRDEKMRRQLQAQFSGGAA